MSEAGRARRRRASSVKSGPAGRDFNASVRKKLAKTKQAKALRSMPKIGLKRFSYAPGWEGEFINSIILK